MRINFKQINTGLEIIKQQIHSKLEPVTTKEPREFQNRLYPYLNVQTAENLILQNNRLSKSIRILSQDVILNDFNYINSTQDTTNIESFWKNNINELYQQMQEYYAYGFGASEIVFDEDTGEPAGLYQIPAKSLYIEQEYNDLGEYSYYAIQQVPGRQNIKMKLSRFQYTDDDYDLPTCFWLGGGKTSSFYEIPYWIPAFNSISAKIALDELNAKKINEGNLMSGILILRHPPDNEEDKDKIHKSLREQMHEAGTGILTLDLESFNRDIPLEADYIPISENNYDYLSRLAERCDEDILACFSIPKVRLMIDDVTESMNSNKSDTIYQIYTQSLEDEQLPFESEINKFNKRYFGYNGQVQLATPIFSDKKEIEINSINTLFNNGLITLGEAVQQISQFYPDIEYDKTNPLFKERYYKGQLLGTNTEIDNEINDIKDAGVIFPWL